MEIINPYVINTCTVKYRLNVKYPGIILICKALLTFIPFSALNSKDPKVSTHRSHSTNF